MKLIGGKEAGNNKETEVACLNNKCFYSCFSWIDRGLTYQNCFYEFTCPSCNTKMIFDSSKDQIVGLKIGNDKKELI